MAQPFLSRRKVFLGAVQADSDPVILSAADGGLLIKEAATSSLVLVNNDRSDVARDTLSNVSNVMGSKAMDITVEGELIPSGSELVLPAVDAIFRSSGLERVVIQVVEIGAISGGPFIRGEAVTTDGTGVGKVLRPAEDGENLYIAITSGAFSDGAAITGGTSGAAAVATADAVAAGFGYLPISTGMEWGTFSLWEDGYQKTIHSAMGSVSFSFESALIGTFSATLKGPITYDETNPQWGSDGGDMPQPTFSAELPPVLLDASMVVSDTDGTNTTTDLIGQKVTLDQSNDVQLRRNMNAVSGLEGSHISKRTPALTVSVEYLTDAQYPVFQKLFNNVDASIGFRLGDGTPGKTIEAYTTVNFNEVSTGAESGLATQDISCSLVDNGTGDNEYYILFI